MLRRDTDTLIVRLHLYIVSQYSCFTNPARSFALTHFRTSQSTGASEQGATPSESEGTIKRKQELSKKSASCFSLERELELKNLSRYGQATSKSIQPSYSYRAPEIAMGSNNLTCSFSRESDAHC